MIEHTENNPVVVSHPFLSSVISARISEDISNKKVEKKLFKNEYNKTMENDIVEKFEIDSKSGFINNYEMKKGNQLIESYKIMNLETLEKGLDLENQINKLKNIELTTTIKQ